MSVERSYSLIVINFQEIFLHFQDGEEKQFIFRHARQIFDLIDEDGSGNNHSRAIKLLSLCC